MRNTKTSELEKVLLQTESDQFDAFRESNKEDMLESGESFSVYFKELLREKNLTQQQVFLRADVSERYGYKLLSGEKRTRQRDVILRLCFAADFTLEETQRFLKMYELPVLYVKMPRDAFLMMLFQENRKNIIEINELLCQKGFEPLRTSGVQE